MKTREKELLGFLKTQKHTAWYAKCECINHMVSGPFYGFHAAWNGVGSGSRPVRHLSIDEVIGTDDSPHNNAEGSSTPAELDEVVIFPQ